MFSNSSYISSGIFVYSSSEIICPGFSYYFSMFCFFDVCDLIIVNSLFIMKINSLFKYLATFSGIVIDFCHSNMFFKFNSSSTL